MTPDRRHFQIGFVLFILVIQQKTFSQNFQSNNQLVEDGKLVYGGILFDLESFWGKNLEEDVAGLYLAIKISPQNFYHHPSDLLSSKALRVVCNIKETYM